MKKIQSLMEKEGRHDCELSFLYLNVNTGVIDSLKFTFPGGIFVGVSDKIQCLIFFWPAQKNDRDLKKSIQRLFKLASLARHLPSFLMIYFVVFLKLYIPYNSNKLQK